MKFSTASFFSFFFFSFFLSLIDVGFGINNYLVVTLYKHFQRYVNITRRDSQNVIIVSSYKQNKKLKLLKSNS